MSCPDTIVKLDLPDTKVGCTWRGLTWALTSVDADETEYSAALSLAEFIATDSAGAVALTLTSATAGQVTINTATANAWSVTVEPRILTLAAGFYPFTLYTTDAAGVRAPRWESTFRIHD
jgi:hypothetical protein